MIIRYFTSAAAALVLATAIGGSAFASDAHKAPMMKLSQSGDIAWIKDPAIVAAIKAQNAKTAGYSESEIIKLDKQWRAEVKSSGGPMINNVLHNSLSAFLKKVKEASHGRFTEIFVMDAKGLNVGQSDVTSDYWQGDEAKWQKTYKVGPKAVHIGKVAMDESTQTLQSQLSMTIVDPATNEVIGAVTIGVNVDSLGQ